MPSIDPVVRRLASYSQGLSLAVEHGPQAGPVVEYVVDNKPQGSGWIGRRVDRWFLNLETNTGTRARVRSTNHLVAEVLTRYRNAKRSTVIFDIASGTARYLRDLARELGPSDDVTIVCHDRNPRQVMWGRELVDRDRLRRFSFAVGDATDEASYLTRHDPDITLAIQLFPYLHDDNEVKAVIRLAHDHLRPGGTFVCTTTVKPPGGSAYWSADAFGRRPACRSAETIHTWLREAGFEQVDQRYSEPNSFALIAWRVNKA